LRADRASQSKEDALKKERSVALLALQQYHKHLPSLRAHAACMQGLLPSDNARSGRETALYLKLSYRELEHTIPDCVRFT
jgi:hypothetical protein